MKFWWLFFPLSLTAQERYAFHHPAMGTEFHLQLYALDSLHAASIAQRAFARIDALEASMSDYRRDSELNQLRPSWQTVSPDLWAVLRFSRRLARRSKGAFDPTIGPLSKLWRRAFRLKEFPARERIIRARARVQWKDLRTAGTSRVKLRRSDMQLDLGGVAKGYTLDVVGKLLEQHGYRSYLIDGGGDLLLGEPPPGKAGWSVVTPNGKHLSPLRNLAVATSGATYRYLEEDGVRYSHIIDPRTGYGVTGHKVVTVIAPTGMVADGLASTLSVLREERRIQSLLKRYAATRER